MFTLKSVQTKNKLTKKNDYTVELVQPNDASTTDASSPNTPAHDNMTHEVVEKPVARTQDAVSSVPILKSPIVGFEAAFKRLFDFLVGGLALIVLLPFFALLSILIKLDSTGPALFYQQRQGRNRDPINVYKFRTMYQNYSTPVPTENSFKQTQKNDPRVTRIGMLLRKTSLDELPQLLNVIEGSMSLVGPRPHPAPLDEQYRHIIPGMNSRYAVKPGLTGWAQIHGLRGETARVEDMVARVEHDCHYIRNWSLWLDIKIIATTALKGWAHRNAY